MNHHDGLGPSPEFLAQQAAWRVYYAAGQTEEDNEEEMNQLCDVHRDAIEALVEKIEAKDTPSLTDVLELAQAHRDGSYEDGVVEHGLWVGQSSVGIEHALVRAVLKMADLDY